MLSSRHPTFLGDALTRCGVNKFESRFLSPNPNSKPHIHRSRLTPSQVGSVSLGENRSDITKIRLFEKLPAIAVDAIPIHIVFIQVSHGVDGMVEELYAVKHLVTAVRSGIGPIPQSHFPL